MYNIHTILCMYPEMKITTSSNKKMNNNGKKSWENEENYLTLNLFFVFVSGCSKKYTFVHDSEESYAKCERETQTEKPNDLLKKSLLTYIFFPFCSMLQY